MVDKIGKMEYNSNNGGEYMSNDREIIGRITDLSMLQLDIDSILLSRISEVDTWIDGLDLTDIDMLERRLKASIKNRVGFLRNRIAEFKEDK